MMTKNQATAHPAVKKLADEKKFPVEHIVKGVFPMRGDDVMIVYVDANKNLGRPRIRHATGNPRFTWATKYNVWWKHATVEDLPILPYGLWMNPKLDTKWCILGEGESDGWACYYHYFPYLGLPGATNLKCLKLSHIRQYERIYIHQEGDDGGRRFAESLPGYLRQIGFAAPILTFNLERYGVKDLADLHVKGPSDFPARLQNAYPCVSGHDTSFQGDAVRDRGVVRSRCRRAGYHTARGRRPPPMSVPSPARITERLTAESLENCAKTPPIFGYP